MSEDRKRVGSDGGLSKGLWQRQPISPRRQTMSEAMDDLREAWLDLAVHAVRTFGIVWLVQRLGLRLRPWIQRRRLDREERP